MKRKITSFKKTENDYTNVFVLHTLRFAIDPNQSVNSDMSLSETVNHFLPSSCKLLLIRMSAKTLKCLKMLTIRLTFT